MDRANPLHSLPLLTDDRVQALELRLVPSGLRLRPLALQFLHASHRHLCRALSEGGPLLLELALSGRGRAGGRSRRGRHRDQRFRHSRWRHARGRSRRRRPQRGAQHSGRERHGAEDWQQDVGRESHRGSSAEAYSLLLEEETYCQSEWDFPCPLARLLPAQSFFGVSLSTIPLKDCRRTPPASTSPLIRAWAKCFACSKVMWGGSGGTSGST